MASYGFSNYTARRPFRQVTVLAVKMILQQERQSSQIGWDNTLAALVFRYSGSIVPLRSGKPKFRSKVLGSHAKVVPDGLKLCRGHDLSALCKFDDVLRYRTLCCTSYLKLDLDRSQDFARLSCDRVGPVRQDILVPEVGQRLPENVLEATRRKRPNDLYDASSGCVGGCVGGCVPILPRWHGGAVVFCFACRLLG